MNGILIEFVCYFFSFRSDHSSNHFYGSSSTGIVKGSASISVNVVNIDVSFNAKIKSLFPLEDGRKMKSILTFTVVYMNVSSILLKNFFDFLLDLEKCVLKGCAF
jgi:hypothetical protein